MLAPRSLHAATSTQLFLSPSALPSATLLGGCIGLLTLLVRTFLIPDFMMVLGYRCHTSLHPSVQRGVIRGVNIWRIFLIGNDRRDFPKEHLWRWHPYGVLCIEYSVDSAQVAGSMSVKRARLDQAFVTLCGVDCEILRWCCNASHLQYCLLEWAPLFSWFSLTPDGAGGEEMIAGFWSLGEL